MSLNKKFQGTGVAVVTPFSHGNIDFHALSLVLNHIINGGVEFIVSLGTTGEATSLSNSEARSVLDFTIKEVDGRVPLVYGAFGGNNTAELVHKLKTTDFAGVDAVMSSSPAYVKPTQDGLYGHYMAMADASPKPMIIYNVPSRTAMNVRYETTLKLASTHTNFLGVKEASTDMFALGQLIKYRPDGFLVFSGDDMTAWPTMALGADGCISVIANAFPAIFSDMIRSGLSGELNQGAALHARLLDIHPWLYTEGNPAGIKAALEDIGLCSREVRLPLTPLSEGANESLIEAIQKAGLPVQAQ